MVNKKIKKKKLSPPPINTFNLSFLGEYVSVTTTMKIKTQESTEESVFERNQHILLEGYLLDRDKYYYYMGNTSKEITHAIKRVRVIFIEILPIKNQYDDLLDHMPDPESGDKLN